MFKPFYIKLAVSNLSKNRKSYLPFLITGLITVMLYFDLYMIMDNSGLKMMPGAASLRSILGFGRVIVGIFSFIFLFYTNSFLMKQRRKEIGLYNVLGMGKKELSIIMIWESLITGCVIICAGILSGMVFGKLLFLILYKITGYDSSLQYELSIHSIFYTALLFIIVFFFTFLFNLIQVKKANPVELLRGGTVGEKEPKTNIVIAFLGVITLGAGYILANVVTNPIEAIGTFFIAVLLVIIGTYALFLSGSIAFFKLLKKNKSFYYNARHFHSVSGMIYRMKQNAVGLANICILSTMVLITVSTTVSLNMGMENILSNRFPKELIVTLDHSDENIVKTVDTIISEELNRQGLKQKNRYRCQYVTVIAEKQNQNFHITGVGSTFATDKVMIQFAPVSYYNEMTGEHLSLSDEEAVLYSSSKKPYGEKTFSIDNKTLHIVEEPDTIPMEKKQDFPLMESYLLFLKDESKVMEMVSEVSGGKGAEISYTYGFDLTGSEQKKEAAATAITKRIQTDHGYDGYVELRGAYKEDFHTFYGGFLFLGIFLGGLFLMATVLIIYYKQISEGMEDKNRYQIMQKVGMSRKEIKRSINSQIRIVFFLPLAMAAIHVIAAFQLMRKMLVAFNLSNASLFIACTVGTILVFSLIYWIVFRLTAREYYKIVTR